MLLTSTIPPYGRAHTVTRFGTPGLGQAVRHNYTENSTVPLGVDIDFQMNIVNPPLDTSDVFNCKGEVPSSLHSCMHC